MKKFVHGYRRGALPLTGDQRKMKNKIEKAKMKDVSPEEYDAFISERGREEFSRFFAEFMKGLLESSRNYRLLEVGFGSGVITKELKNIPNLEVFGLEKDKKYVDYALEAGRTDRDHLTVGDFHELPFTDASFDLYTGVAILNHVGDRDKFYQEALRVLHVGGRIVIPWLHPKKESIEREKEYLKKHGIELEQEGEWFLIGRK